MHIEIVIILWKGHMDFSKLRFWMSKDEWFENSAEPYQSISYQQNIELVLLFASAAHKCYIVLNL